jgi:hypothetical protein
MKMLNRPGVWLAATLAAALVLLGTVRGQQVHRNGFEVREPLWVKGPANATFREVQHVMTEDGPPHSGQRCELIQIEVEAGTSVEYHYDPGRAPVSDELTMTVWVKANRPGTQLMARLVLPHTPNPDRPGEPLTAPLYGPRYERAGRWQRLEMARLQKAVIEQQQKLRVKYNRDIDLRDAYVDRVVLNICSGPGRTDVYLDDLEVSPVLEAPRDRGKDEEKDGVPGTPASRAAPRRPAVVELDRDQLLVGGKRFFFRAIRHTDTPLKTLRDAGFNTVWLDSRATPDTVEEAVNNGFWLVPAVPLARGTDTTVSRGSENYLVSQDAVGRLVSRYMEQDAVLFWDIGAGGLAVEHADHVTRTAKLVHARDPQRPLGADVWDGFQTYSRNVNLLGVHRWPLMTSLEMTSYRDWLNQRRLLANPGTFMWTWVQTHLPEWHTQLVYNKTASDGFDEPIGPLPEQVRLLTYVSLSAGCRGLGFWSDRFLADSHHGRDRLLTLALLNQEMQMLEPLLVSADPPTWIDTSAPDVKAAVFRCDRAMLVLPIWVGRGAQYVPGQAAQANLVLVVPGVPPSAQAWEVSPGAVRSLKTKRIPGGTYAVVPEFGLTSAVVFTADNGPNGLLVHLQDQARRRRKAAAQWAHDLASVELDKALKVQAKLEAAGQNLPDQADLAKRAQEFLQQSVKHYNDGDFQESYLAAQRAVRPVRLLMRAQWEKAAGDLDTPVSSPYAVSFFALPKHWEFVEQLRRLGPAANALPNGDFELAGDRTAESWQAQEATMDEVQMTGATAPAALERTFLAIHSPAVRLEPGTPVRITGWVRIPGPIQASADGAMLYDSAGGEPMAVRLTGTTKTWRQFTLYRKVPASGSIHLTLALTGLGKVYFDDLRIEPLVAGRGTLVEGGGEFTLRSPKPPDDRGVEPYHFPKRELMPQPGQGAPAAPRAPTTTRGQTPATQSRR